MLCSQFEPINGFELITEVQHGVCVEVAMVSSLRSVDPKIAVSIAYHESRFTNTVGEAGAYGPMQIKPKYWCRSKDCNYVIAGVDALKYLHENKGKWDLALCHYASGNICYESSRRYSQKILSTVRMLD